MSQPQDLLFPFVVEDAFATPLVAFTFDNELLNVVVDVILG